MKVRQATRMRVADCGFSLIEVVVAMLMLGLLSLAVLPLLVTTAGVSADSRARVSANAQADAEIALLRQQFRDDLENACSAISSAAATRTGEKDRQTGQFTKVRVESCPTTLPGTVEVTVEIHPTEELDQAIATISTELLVVAA